MALDIIFPVGEQERNDDEQGDRSFFVINGFGNMSHKRNNTEDECQPPCGTKSFKHEGSCNKQKEACDQNEII